MLLSRRRAFSFSLARQQRADLIAGALIFCAMLLVFWLSPVYQGNDSNYSMLLSESLLHHGTFRLDAYNIPRLAPVYREDYVANGDIYQLEYIDNHLYYFFPPGSSVLAVPYVALMNALGISAANADNTYNAKGEMKIEASLAALLMATLASVFYFTSRLLLPRSWSLILALAGSLGTQVWSSASRGLSSDTWGILLLGCALWMILAQETRKRTLNPITLATLLSWMYFVRPTNAVHILAITIYLLVFQRRILIKYALTGATWLAGFTLYSWHNFGQRQPNYFMTKRLGFGAFWTALAGNLVSPSRGVLVFIPALLFVAYVLVWYRRTQQYTRLIMLAVAVIAGHLVAVSGFTHWWGGAGYGARFMTGLVPWFMLLAVLGIDAMRREQQAFEASEGKKARRKEFVSLTIGGALLLLSVWINGRGALSPVTAKWNNVPENIDKTPERLWNWRAPQFLAGLTHPALPRAAPLIEAPTRIDFTSHEADKFLWYGWSAPETEFRWTEERAATIIFSTAQASDVALQIKCAPFLFKEKLFAQRVLIDFNGKQIDEWRLADAAASVYSLILPQSALRSSINVLTFKLPDAAAPKDLTESEDARLLGLAVQWIEIAPSANER